MKHVLVTVVCAGLLLCTGCLIADEAMDPEATLYGRFKADVIYDTQEMSGTSAQYVAAESGDRLGITSRETRLGVKISQGESLSGKAEWDLYGAGAGENKSGILLRQLWVKMKLNDNMSVLVGQTGDVFSPLLPAVLNYGWGWNCGNPGYRRPQVRFECAKSGIICQVAAARGIGTEDSATPDWQGRLAYTQKDDEGKTKMTVGVSALQGFTDADRTDQRSGTALDLQLNLGKLVVRGEYFMGENLAPYLAGIGQNVKTNGGWIQMGAKLSEKITLNLGYLYDDPENATDSRNHNSAIFANVRGKLNEKTQVGLEVMNWDTVTDVAGIESTLNNLRVAGSVIFTF